MVCSDWWQLSETLSNNLSHHPPLKNLELEKPGIGLGTISMQSLASASLLFSAKDWDNYFRHPYPQIHKACSRGLPSWLCILGSLCPYSSCYFACSCVGQGCVIVYTTGGSFLSLTRDEGAARELRPAAAAERKPVTSHSFI